LQHKKTAIVKKTYTKAGNNKFLGIIDQAMLNTILGVLSVAGVTVIGYKVFFSNGKKEEEQPKQQPTNQGGNWVQQPQQLQNFGQIQQSPDLIRNQIAGNRRNGLMVQENASNDIANNVAMISNTGQQPVFAQQPPTVGQQQPIVKTKEEIMQQHTKQPHKLPAHGDDYYNALSGYKSPFLLTTPKPAEVNSQ
jgi:hypothetical protein